MSMQLLKCISSRVLDELPRILEDSKYGKAVAALVKAVKDGIRDSKELEPLIAEAKREIRQEGEKEKPAYMDCVIFECKDNVVLKEEEQEALRNILMQEDVQGDERSKEIIEIFINEYMGGEVDFESEEYCEIGRDYISFNFFEEYNITEYPYDEEDMELVRTALNKLLGREVLGWYRIYGHMESNLE